MSLLDNIKQLESKQKLMLIVTIGCLGLVFYLAYSTFFPDTGGATPAPTIQAKNDITPQTPPPAPNQTLESTNNIAPTPTQENNANTANVNNAPNVELAKTTTPVPQDLALLAQSQRLQQQYMQLVNEYQLAQLQQKLAQVDAQIVASKLTTTKSLVELKKAQLLLGTNGSETNLSGTETLTTNTAPATPNYQTMFVGAVGGKWQAMLSSNNQYYQVSVGMNLPDGSVVTKINSRGVVLTNPGGTPVFLPMNKNLD